MDRTSMDVRWHANADARVASNQAGGAGTAPEGPDPSCIPTAPGFPPTVGVGDSRGPDEPVSQPLSAHTGDLGSTATIGTPPPATIAAPETSDERWPATRAAREEDPR